MKRIFTAVALLLLCLASLLDAQMIRQVRPFQTKGTVKEVGRNGMVMNDSSGRSWQLRFSGKEGYVTLAKNVKFRAPRPKIAVSGNLSVSDLKKGMAVRLECYVTDEGRVNDPVSAIQWVETSGFKPGVKQNRKKSNNRGETLCQVTGTVDRVDPEGFMVQVPKSRMSQDGMMAIPLDKAAKISVKSRDLSKAREGDFVVDVSGVELSTGDFVVQNLVVRLKEKARVVGETRKRRGTVIRSPTAMLDAKYEQLSDEPVAARKIRDPLIVLTTDLSDRKARILLDECKELLGILARYYGRPTISPLECFVVDDMQQWPASQLPPDAKAAVDGKESKLVRKSGNSRSVLAAIYAPSNTKEVRANLIKAYCYQVFGGTGPGWYRQGMSEVARFWQEPMNEVHADATMLKILREKKNRMSLKEILMATSKDEEEPASPEDSAARGEAELDAVNANQRSRSPGKETASAGQRARNRRGGKAVTEERRLTAHRWALAYLMANNPNYRRKFLELGVGLMTGRDVSLKKSFGKSAKQLAFELTQFTDNVTNGYRMDLCAWNWKQRPKDLGKSGTQKFVIKAKLGWQPAVNVEKGVSYDLVAKGAWKIDGTGTKATADGDESGRGKLVAVIMDKFQLGEEIPIGKGATFTAPASGTLYVRCAEDWGALADNSGMVTAHVRKSNKR